ncbi:MAG TPA: glycosyltransferase family 4 protein [Micromonosporaceae bacterium]
MSATLRVALLLASSTGGIGRHVASLAHGLSARGADVTVYGPVDTEQRFRFTALGAGFDAVEIPASPGPRDYAAVATLRRALRARRPDVVHAHGLRAGLVAALARPPRTPLVVTWHNVPLGDGLRARFNAVVERRVARAATVTLGASSDLVTRARQLGARDARLSPVAAPALPAPTRDRAAVRAELGAGPARPLVLSVGRLHPQKGYHTLIDAATTWRDLMPPPLVAIAGSGPAHEELAAHVSDKRAPVVLLGHRSDVPDLLGAADLAVVSSVWEARQLFAQEAMRAGVPLVATDVGGLPELVGDAVELVPPGDVAALSAAVRRLLCDADLRARLARRGLARAATWPDEQDTVADVAAVYRELTGTAVRP